MTPKEKTSDAGVYSSAAQGIRHGRHSEGGGTRSPAGKQTGPIAWHSSD
jgi:hypothetical protein